MDTRPFVEGGTSSSDFQREIERRYELSDNLYPQGWKIYRARENDLLLIKPSSYSSLFGVFYFFQKGGQIAVSGLVRAPDKKYFGGFGLVEPRRSEFEEKISHLETYLNPHKTDNEEKLRVIKEYSLTGTGYS